MKYHIRIPAADVNAKKKSEDANDAANMKVKPKNISVHA